MQIKYEELKRRIKQGTKDPLYLFIGEEVYLIEEAIHDIRNSFLTEEEKEANCHIFYGSDLKWDNFLALAQTFPFVGKNRFIVLKRIEEMKKEEAARLATFLKKKHSSLYMILTAEKKVDQRTVLAKVLNEKAVTVQFYKMFENQVPPWIVQKVKNSGRNIPFHLAQIMAQMLGNDLSRISGELTKIYLYMGQDKQITQEHLAIVSGESRIFSVFDFVKNLGEKQIESSIKILDKLMEEGTSPILLLTMIARQFRHIYLAKSLLEKGGGVKEVIRATGLPMMFARQIAGQTGIFSYDQLRTLFERFLEIDRQLKSSSCNPRFILEGLTIEVCRSF